MVLSLSALGTAFTAESEDRVALRATGPTRQWSVSARWENDSFGGTDRYYTAGVSLGVAHTGPSWADPVANWLPWGQGRRTVTYDVGMAMMTPDDITLSVPDPEDRPYAGILAAGLTLHVDHTNSSHGLKFVTGVVGPWSFAGETQREVHRIIGAPIPQGWDYQLHNEPILNLAYEYRHRFPLLGRRRDWSFEALPIAGGWLGNVLTQASGSGMVRCGFNMPDDFGPMLARGMSPMPPPRFAAGPDATRHSWGFFVFGSVTANLVVHDLTLDGNTFVDSPSVDRNPFVPAAAFGVGVAQRRFLFSFTYSFWGEEFEAQDEPSKLGTFALSWFF